MSPLKIILLLNLHTCVNPVDQYQPAMTEAFSTFAKDGLLSTGATYLKFVRGGLPYPSLSLKGQALAIALQNIGDY